MGYASIKLPDKAKPLLHRLKLRMMRRRGSYVPDGEVVYEALKMAKTEAKAAEKGSWEAIKGFAGALKISDEKAEGWKNGIRKRRDEWRSS